MVSKHPPMPPVLRRFAGRGRADIAPLGEGKEAAVAAFAIRKPPQRAGIG
jgi:hypothetical protein